MKNFAQVQGIILAGGKGTRMKATEKNKVMFEIGGVPMIAFPVRALKALGIEKPIVVVGFARESIQEYLKDSVEYAVQENMEGTADAVRVAMPLVRPETQHVVVLYGDSIFYTVETLEKLVEELLEKHIKTGAAMTLITAKTNPTGYGRILRDAGGKMIGIVEEKNATEEQRKITEISTGNAVYTTAFLKKYLSMIQRNPLSKEFYFTDIVELGFQHHENIETFLMPDSSIGVAVNTLEQLTSAEQELKKRQD